MFAFLAPLISGLGSLFGSAASAIGSAAGGLLSTTGTIAGGALSTTGTIAGGALTTAGTIAGGIGTGVLGTVGGVVSALPTLPGILKSAGEVYATATSIFDKPKAPSAPVTIQQPQQQPIQGQLSSFLPFPIPIPTSTSAPAQPAPNYMMIAVLGVGAYLLLRK